MGPGRAYILTLIEIKRNQTVSVHIMQESIVILMNKEFFSFTTTLQVYPWTLDTPLPL